MTLVELLVGLVVSTIVLAAVLAIATATSRTYHDGRRVRERQSSARSAIDAVQRVLNLAGYGVDPQFAFDFDYYRCQNAAGMALPYSTAGCAAAVRDRMDGPDELVVYHRNPAYQLATGQEPVGQAWRLPAGGVADSTQLTLALRGGDFLGQGQVLQIVCPGAVAYTYVTVASSLTPRARARGKPPPRASTRPSRSAFCGCIADSRRAK